jgi:3-mercaptopyruvate sulfurtransferase SseA
MTKIKTVLTTFILLLFSLACGALPATDTVSESAPPAGFTAPVTEADVPRVTVEEAKAAFDEGTAIIVDVRSQAAYEASHVDGALSIPLNEFETNIAGVDLPRDQWIITYCT